MRIAILDDYQGVALGLADWDSLRADVHVFRDAFADEEAVAAALAEYEVVVAMRERTRFAATTLGRLPRLKLLVTTGPVNAAIDLDAARRAGITVCGTGYFGYPTVELTWGLILSAARLIPQQVDSVRRGGWQQGLGTSLRGGTLGLLGLGRLGTAVAEIGRAFGMRTIAWSQNLTPADARAKGAEHVSRRGRTRKAVEVLRSVDGELNDHPDLVRTLHTTTVLLSDQDQEVRQEVYRRLSETAEHSPELVGPAGQALLVRHAASAGLTSARDAMRRLRALLAEPTDPLTEPFLVGTAATVAQWADELDEADRLVDRGLAGQRPDLLHPMHQALLHSRSDIAAARADYTHPPAVPESVTPGNAHAHTLVALVETGRTARAESLVAGLDLREAADSWELNRFLYARGVVRAAAGDPAAAQHDIQVCGRRPTPREVSSPVV
ncbi:NAD(P)-dependent oxidoreductase, partial [Streptomyces sp. NPDC048279]|uniref:NAD(P)-dependent oxidoreductase n=1 Tax=Streptomyces sp. NPDC048279 TaxID=3154714 RepID=UPI00341912B1